MFTAGPGAVLRFGGDAYVCAARYGDVVLYHYAFAQHWFKINLTTDLAGKIVERATASSAALSRSTVISRPRCAATAMRYSL